MDNFLKDMFERFATEASRLAKYSNKVTLGNKEIEAAVTFLLPGELAKQAHVEGIKALVRYNSSKANENL